MAREFTVMVERDPDSGCLVRQVKELPACFTEAPDPITLHAHLPEAITVHKSVTESNAADLTDFIEW
ncbi:MAG TPA: hypothetical protein VGR16_13420 [Thermomicrobiales bacterium]|nr:hypothetical protein [Thermomicrobiales bacterium]